MQAPDIDDIKQEYRIQKWLLVRDVMQNVYGGDLDRSGITSDFILKISDRLPDGSVRNQVLDIIRSTKYQWSYDKKFTFCSYEALLTLPDNDYPLPDNKPQPILPTGEYWLPTIDNSKEIDKRIDLDVAVNKLSSKPRMVILSMLDGRTQRYIANKLGVKEARVSQIVSEAYKQLRLLYSR